MFKKDVKTLELKNIRKIALFIFLILILSILSFPATFSQHSDDPGMPNYAKGIVVDQHYIIIEQDSAHSLVVEEQITYRNTGDENHTGDVFAWSQPGDILSQIYRFEFEIGSARKSVNPTPAGNFLKTNFSAYNITIKPQETFRLIFIYPLVYDNPEKFYFGTTFLYNTSEVLLIITPQEDYSVEGDENVKLIYQSEAKKYATEHANTLSMVLGESILITFSEKIDVNGNGDDTKNGDDESNMTLYLILIIIVILIVLTMIIRFYFHKKSLEIEREEQEKLQKKEPTAKQIKGVEKPTRKSPPATKRIKHNSESSERPKKSKSASQEKSKRQDLISEKKKILKTQERMKRDYKDGLITKEMFENLKNDYKQKLKKINKRLEKEDKQTGNKQDQDFDENEQAPELNMLIARKEKILKAINRLEEDKESGRLDPELYEEMVGAYKKQAIEILEKIDELKES
jgi:hypothetical protein